MTIKRGVKIVKSGKDINSTNPQDFLINTELDGSVIIYKDAEVSVTVPANSTVKDTQHYYDPTGVNQITFDFIPIILIYVEMTSGSNKWFLSPFTFVESGDPEDTTIYQNSESDTGVKTDSFFVSLHNKTASQKVIKYHYYIFANLGE
jgi:hypothetical protein